MCVRAPSRGKHTPTLIIQVHSSFTLVCPFRVDFLCSLAWTINILSDSLTPWRAKERQRQQRHKLISSQSASTSDDVSSVLFYSTLTLTNVFKKKKSLKKTARIIFSCAPAPPPDLCTGWGGDPHMINDQLHLWGEVMNNVYVLIIHGGRPSRQNSTRLEIAPPPRQTT